MNVQGVGVGIGFSFAIVGLGSSEIESLIADGGNIGGKGGGGVRTRTFRGQSRHSGRRFRRASGSGTAGQASTGQVGDGSWTRQLSPQTAPAAPSAQGLGNQLTTNSGQLNHMFRSSSGHFTQSTPANNELIVRTANNPHNFMGVDAHGNQWFAQLQPNGTQVWARVRNGIITEAGLNQTPRLDWHPQTGLNQPPRS